MPNSNINPNANVNPDPWDVIGTEYVQTYEYYGQIDIKPVMMVFPGEKGSHQRPVVYDPKIHAGKNPFYQIQARLQVIPDQPISYSMERNWKQTDPDWNKITMLSIRKLGFVRADNVVDVRRFDGQWVKLENVEGYRQNRTEPEKGNYKTWKFTGVYADKEECRKAYLTEHPQSGNEPTAAASTSSPIIDDQAKKFALQFIETTIKEAYKNGAQYEEAAQKAEQFINANAAACAGLTIDSPEVKDLLNDVPF